MSIIVPAPISAPMLITAPIMTMTRSPMTAPSRMNEPGSMRAFTPLRSSSGSAELRRSFSTW